MKDKGKTRTSNKTIFTIWLPLRLTLEKGFKFIFYWLQFLPCFSNKYFLTKKTYSVLHTFAIIACSECDNFSMFSLTLGHNAFKFDLFHLNLYRKVQLLNRHNFFVIQSCPTHFSPNTTQSIPVPSSPVPSSAVQPSSVQ